VFYVSILDLSGLRRGFASTTKSETTRVESNIEESENVPGPESALVLKGCGEGEATTPRRRKAEDKRLPAWWAWAPPKAFGKGRPSDTPTLSKAKRRRAKKQNMTSLNLTCSRGRGWPHSPSGRDNSRGRRSGHSGWGGGHTSWGRWGAARNGRGRGRDGLGSGCCGLGLVLEVEV
jgi:hypothetical protein